MIWHWPLKISDVVSWHQEKFLARTASSAAPVASSSRSRCGKLVAEYFVVENAAAFVIEEAKFFFVNFLTTAERWPSSPNQQDGHFRGC